jgi:rubredoxin
MLRRGSGAATLQSPSEERPVESTLNKEGLAADAEWIAGARAKGEFRCGGCGYGVTVYRSLPVCPMCHGTEWERVPWRPYTRVVSPMND